MGDKMLYLINENEFDKMYLIMKKSFPEDEYRPYDEQKALLKNKFYNLYVEKKTRDCVSAFIALWNFKDFVFIEHFAVDISFRNQGYGSLILNEVKEKTNKIICLEVEVPNTEITKRRVGFYERNGFYLNSYPYIQPPISTGKNPVPLMIMTSNRNIDIIEFNNIKECLYKNVYKYDILTK